MTCRSTRRVWLLVGLGLWLAPTAPMGAAEADRALGETPLGDVLAVVVAQRNLLAIDARLGGQTTEKLRLHEKVLWTGSRGVVGIALTDQRILAASAKSSSWAELDVRRVEKIPQDALLGERVILLVTSERAIGFIGRSGNLVEVNLGVRESVLASRVGENVGVLVTSRRALGLSAFTGGFSGSSLGIHENIESVVTNANLAIVTTDRRILIYRAPTGSWEERSLNLK